MEKIKNRTLAVTAALGALTVFLGATRLGFFPWFTGVTITVLHIPAILAAILEGSGAGVAVGAIFGVFSLFQANVAPISPIDIAFRNPLVSVLPRLLYPLITVVMYRMLKKRPAISAFIAATVSTVFHTIMVLTALWLTQGSGILTGASGKSVAAIIGAVLFANGIPEALTAGVIASAVVAARLKIGTKKISKLMEHDEQ